MADGYYLLDLERTLGFGRLFFWKKNKHGYTSSLENAGVYSRAVAIDIVRKDLDHSTIMIARKRVVKILGKDLTPDAGTITIFPN